MEPRNLAELPRAVLQDEHQKWLVARVGCGDEKKDQHGASEPKELEVPEQRNQECLAQKDLKAQKFWETVSLRG